MIRISDGDISSLPDIAALVERAFPAEYGEGWNASQLRSMMSLRHVRSYVAHRENALVGFAIVRTILEECEILLIAVDPDSRRKGVATGLLQQLTSEAKAMSVTRLFLEMREGNAAEALYTAHGFRPVGRRTDYYRGPTGLRYDAITFADIVGQ